jgi:DNA polymerase elongation subunit (family B)
VNAVWDGVGALTVISRGEDGWRQVREVAAAPACFLRLTDVDVDTLRMLTNSRAIVALKIEGDWLRVEWRSRDELKAATSKPRWGKDGESFFDQLKLATYEADVHPVRRWMVESDAVVQRPRGCYLDLETDSRVPFSKKESARILCWSVRDAVTGKVAGTGVLDTDDDASEKRLLQQLWQVLARYDQVIAWNGSRFDFPMVRARTREMGVNVNFRHWLWLDHLELFRKLNVSASESGDEKQSMALEAVAQAVLGEGKDDFDSSRSWDAWFAGGEERARLVTYNARDTELMHLIEQVTGYIELQFTICELCGTFPDDYGSHGTQFVEAFLMRLARQRQMHFKTQWDIGETNPFKGAFVMEPTRRGILHGVHVADFSGMYPSIIESWNLSPETLTDIFLQENAAFRPSYLVHVPIKKRERPADLCEVPNYGYCFKTQPVGLLPEAVTHVGQLRKAWNEKKKQLAPGTPEWKEADRRATAYKIVRNIFYGVISSPFSRFFKREVGESTAGTGSWLIQETMKVAESRSLLGFYGDTDSGFVLGGTDAEFQSFVDHCNRKLYPRLLAEHGCQRNEVKLAYEKKFKRLIMVGKKRYAASYEHFAGTPATADSKPEIKGLEYKRGDTVRLARAMQKQLIDRLLGAEDPEAMLHEFIELVTTWKERVLQGSLELRDFTQAEKLGKELREYRTKKKKDGSDAAQPAHVQVAKILKARGSDVGEGARIEFVVVDASSSPMKVIPACDYASGVEDRFYLWESLVYAPSQRVLEACFPAHPWASYAKCRPPKSRPAPKPRSTAKHRAAPTGQASLFGNDGAKMSAKGSGDA